MAGQSQTIPSKNTTTVRLAGLVTSESLINLSEESNA